MTVQTGGFWMESTFTAHEPAAREEPEFSGQMISWLPSKVDSVRCATVPAHTIMV